MTETKKTKLLFGGIGIFFGWLFGGTVNAFWFFYSVQSLGFGESDPLWYINALGIIRPAVILLSMTAGYFVSEWYFRRSSAKGRFKGKDS